MSPIKHSHNEVADSKQGHEGIGKKLETWQIAFCLWEIGSQVGRSGHGANVYMTSAKSPPPLHLSLSHPHIWSDLMSTSGAFRYSPPLPPLAQTSCYMAPS